MTRASKARASKRIARKPAGANGSGAGAPPGSVPLKAADKQRLEKAQEPIRGLLIEKGAIDVDIEKARAKTEQLTVRIEQKRKDFREVMRAVLISHGLDPDVRNGSYNIDVDKDVIVFTPGRSALAPPAAQPPPAPGAAAGAVAEKGAG